MRERPILFSGPMVRAILDGQKTQTRRVLLPQPVGEPRPLEEWSRRIAATCGDYSPDPQRTAAHVERLRGRIFPFADEGGRLMGWTCPHGRVGDRLWVRETWGLVNNDGYVVTPSTLCYRAAGPERLVWPDELLSHEPRQIPRRGWRPSIHMPRWTSRLTLKLTGVRVERVQDISDADAQAEGIEHDGTWWRAGTHPVKGSLQCWPTARRAYERLWNELNAKRGYGWDVNPWVWCLTFHRVEP